MQTPSRMTYVVIAMIMFMNTLDDYILNTAIPNIAKSLAVNPVSLKMALVSYLLAFAIFIPISGWIGDKWGIKKVCLAAITLFTVSSFFCGFSHTPFELTIARFAQGIGGAMCLPLSKLIVLHLYGRSQLVKIMTKVVIVGSFGGMLGPTLGGYISAHYYWAWIFWINIPLGVLTLILAKQFIPTIITEVPPPLDKIGFLLFGAGLMLLTLGLNFISYTQNIPIVSVLLIVVSILFFIFYRKHARVQEHPIINLTLFQTRTFRVATLGVLFVRIGMGGVLFLLPLLLQIGIGYSSEVAGLIMMLVALGVFFCRYFALFSLRLLGFRTHLFLNTFLISLDLYWMTTITAHTSMWLICMMTFVYGALLSQLYTAMNSLGFVDIEPGQLSMATSMLSTLEQFTKSLGITFTALLLQGFGYYFKNTHLTMSVFHLTLLVDSLVVFLSGFVYFKLKARDGAEMV